MVAQPDGGLAEWEPMPGGETIFSNFLELWQSMQREAGKLPSRRDFGPSLAPALMPHMFLARVNGAFDIEIRLIGSALEGNPGGRMTGSNYFDQLAPESRDFHEAFISGYRLHPCAGRVTRHVGGEDGLAFDLHTLAAPLADEGGEGRFIVGASYMEANHQESTGRRLSGVQAVGFVNARVVDARYIDLGFGTPETLPGY
jgi:hypothetical protein